MGGTAATLHWHGILQKKTPYFDGVPFITQCPIDFSTKFRYAFSAVNSGTNFYHGHSGHHRLNGLYSALIVRKPDTDDRNSELYNFDRKEHAIVLSDWSLGFGEW